MIELKIFLYDSQQEVNGYRGTDLSDYLLSGSQNTEDLTEELDVTEITLSGYPERAEFAPETKFIIDVYEDGAKLDDFTMHRCVQEDVVEQPILSNEEYFDHSITLTEPSVIAQKRVVDDIAITYELKNVTLNVLPTFSVDAITNNGITGEPEAPQRGFARYVDSTSFSNTTNISFGKYFKWENYGEPTSEPKIIAEYTSGGATVQSNKKYINTNSVDNQQVRFRLPFPRIMWGKQDTAHRPPQILSPAYEALGIASFDWEIIEADLNGIQTVVDSGTMHSSSNLYTALNGDATFPYAPDVENFNILDLQPANWLCEKVLTVYNTFPEPPMFRYYFKQYTVSSSTASDLSDHPLYTSSITISPDKVYFVNVKIHDYENEFPTIQQGEVRDQIVGWYRYTGESILQFCYAKFKTGIFVSTVATNAIPIALPSTNIGGSIAITTYNDASQEILFEKAVSYSAADVIKKAILNSGTYVEQTGTPVSSLRELDCPFYIKNIAEEGKLTEEDLQKVNVNESFFHQKNLWEVLLEVGKYAHAIPEINFGADEKFEITFNKLGTTDTTIKTNTRSSIMNFRKVDDYVSACSSYVDNLVQLGGTVVELCAPKTQSEEYLVDNDTACILTSKPIIELVKLTAIAAKNMTFNYDYYDDDNNHITGTMQINEGDEQDITDFIYEKNVYGILDVVANFYPNKGIAMYYELGDNAIKGGDYQLPTKYTNPYHDYAFKKILYTAFTAGTEPRYKYIGNIGTSSLIGTAPWYNLKVNDFLFKVEYRTKDTARLEHTRPDLRHYLLQTKYDDVPTHKQFNNQQDVLVDSVAFGNNLYGKLIRTGNSNYKETLWSKSCSELLHKGDLCYVEDELYYVAKVTNIFFPNHIESIVEYSKDYNQLSEIIGIPSEPRFWEISERNIIDREVSIADYILATEDISKIDINGKYIQDIDHTKSLIFGGGGTFLKWAQTTLKGSQYTPDADVPIYGQIEADFSKTVLSPINAYSSGNTLTYEWDMADNFSAGDEVSAEVEPENVGNVADNAYRTLRAVQYCDKYGKATLFDFGLFGELSLTTAEIRNLPNSPTLNPAEKVVGNANSIILLKDCRETLHFNYNLMLLTDSDRFITTPFFFAIKSGTARIVALSEELTKLSTGYFNANTIISEAAATITTIGNKYIQVEISSFLAGITVQKRKRIKAIAIYDDGQIGASVLRKFIIGRNCSDYNAGQYWYFGTPNKNSIWSRSNNNKQ